MMWLLKSALRLRIWWLKGEVERHDEQIRTLGPLVEEAERRQAEKERSNPDPPADAGDSGSGH